MGAGAAPWVLPKVWAAGNERYGFLVVHRHAGKGFTDVPWPQRWIRVAVGAFGVHVNEAHLYGGERFLEIAVARVALVSQPCVLRAQ